jgi:hypothetical protein
MKADVAMAMPTATGELGLVRVFRQARRDALIVPAMGL